MIFVFHGKDSSAEKSLTVQKVKSYFEYEGDFVFAPTYNSADAWLDIKEQLVSFVEEKIAMFPHEELVFVGCSLGGYWAKYLANRFGGKLVMMNPSLRFYGKPETDKLDLPISVLLGLDDEVVDPAFTYDFYKNRAKVMVFGDGDHRMLAYLDKFILAIKEMINTYVD